MMSWLGHGMWVMDIARTLGWQDIVDLIACYKLVVEHFRELVKLE